MRTTRPPSVQSRSADHDRLRHARFVLIIVILQLWLLTATMNAWLGGDDSVVLPAAAASLGCLGLNGGLLRYLGRLERARRPRDV